MRAGADIDGGVYYVERGDTIVQAGGSIHSNSTRSVLPTSNATNPVQWLPTSFFLGKGSIDITGNGDILLGPVANTFLLPQSANNGDYERTLFSTYDTSDAVNVASLGGQITLQGDSAYNGPLLAAWYLNVLGLNSSASTGASQPWLQALDFTGATPSITDSKGYGQVSTLMPATFRATAFSNNINVVSSETLAPSPTGTLDLLASGNINGLTVNGVSGRPCHGTQPRSIFPMPTRPVCQASLSRWLSTIMLGPRTTTSSVNWIHCLRLSICAIRIG